MNETACSIGIDLGGTAIKYALVTPQGDIIWQNSRPSLARSSRAQIISNLAWVANEAMGIARILGKTPCCIGIGSPGIVDIQQGVVLGGADNLKGWEQVPLATLLREATGLPVYVDNDANLMGLGEYMAGNNAHCRHLLFLTIGTGIGGAIFMNGQLYRGHGYAAGGVGALMLTYEGKEVFWEDVASTAALVRQYRQQAGLDEDAAINGKVIFDQYLQAEPLATKVMQEHSRLLGYGLAGLVHVFSPEKIILGGGISEAGKPYIELVKAATQRYCMPVYRDTLCIEAAQMGNKAGFLGAAYFAMQQLSAQQSPS